MGYFANSRRFKFYRFIPAAALVGWIFLQNAILSNVLQGTASDVFPSVAKGSMTMPSNTQTTAATMPRISFPHTEAIEVSVTKQNWTIVASTSGGCESKFEVILPSSEEFIFKPAHGLARANKGGYEFRPSKGGIVWIQKEHPAKILNELIAFTVDQILGLGRTPPVLPFEVPRQQIQDALASVQTKSYFGCSMDFSVADAWIQNEEQDQQHAVVGTLQYKLARVEKISPSPHEFIMRLMGASHSSTWSHYRQSSSSSRSFMERERNTRTLFDFLIGNWDRSNNDFIHHLAASSSSSFRPSGRRRSASSLLVYIDQNALRDQKVPFDNYLEKALTPSRCRFYWDPVQKLRMYTSFQNVVLERMREHDLVSSWMSPSTSSSSKAIIHPDQLGPLRYMDHRRQALLDRVDRCVDRYGFAHVFQR